MDHEWEKTMDLLSLISVYSTPNNEPVTIHGSHENLECIGVGTDAAVFRCLDKPTYALKLYAKDKLGKLKAEEKVYNTLGDSFYFPTCFTAYDDFLVLSYEEGVTLFDCLLRGIHIPEQVIRDVESAREYVLEKNLNPRDIHLKNILLQNGRAKILDVSEYIHSGNDFRWEHLKMAYEEHYSIIDGKSVPFWMMETVRKWYGQKTNRFGTYEDFSKNVLKFKLLFSKK